MSRKCSGTKKSGDPCPNWAMHGGFVCKSHGGMAPQVKAKALIRYDLETWGLDVPAVDPGETLLALLAQSRVRVTMYAAEVQRIRDEHPHITEAFIATAHGEFGPVGEYVRGMKLLEDQERDRCVTWAAKAIAAGLAERTVRLAENQAELAERALVAALGDIGLSVDQQREASARLAHHLRLVG